MAKVNSVLGKMTGKIGGIVMSISNGQQVAREYNPRVSNPQTSLQVRQRSKMKLMAQLAAVMSPVIYFKRSGMTSPRNKFIAANMQYAYYSYGVASIILENVQLAEGNAGFPQVVANRDAETGITVSLATAAANTVEGVVYALFKKNDDGNLSLFGTKVVTIESSAETRTAPATFKYDDNDILILAFGLVNASGKANALYHDLAVANGANAATLQTVTNLDESIVTYTKTRGTTLAAGQSEVTPVQPNQVRIFATAGSGGTVSGGGTYTIGDNVTLVATPNEGVNFSRWADANSNTTLSTNASWTFVAATQVDAIAIFQTPEGGVPDVNSGFDMG